VVKKFSWQQAPTAQKIFSTFHKFKQLI